MRHPLLATLTCAKLCAALGYDFPTPLGDECYCAEKVQAADTIVGFDLQWSKAPRKKPEREDDRAVPSYEDPDL